MLRLREIITWYTLFFPMLLLGVCLFSQARKSDKIVHQETALTEEQLRVKFGNAVQAYMKACETIDKYPRWSTVGEIRQRGTKSIVVWGKAVSSNATPSHPGWLIDEGNIIVKSPFKTGISYGQYSGEHYYQGETYGRNAFGVLVSCKVYGDFPKPYYTSIKNRDEALKIIKQTRDILIITMKTRYLTKINAEPMNGYHYGNFGDACIELCRFFHIRSFDISQLADETIAQYLKAATTFAKTGQIVTSVTYIEKIFITKEPWITKIKQSEQFTQNQLDSSFKINANEEDNSDGEIDNLIPSLASRVFSNKPELLVNLESALSDNLFQFLKEATPEQKNKVFKTLKKLYPVLSEENLKVRIAVEFKDTNVCAAAIMKLTDMELLTKIAQSNTAIAIRQIANLRIQVLREMEGELNNNQVVIKVNDEKCGIHLNIIDCAEMVWIPAGNFLMGSSDADKSALKLDDKKTQRTVYLDGYWIYKTEVTVAQFRRFCQSTGYKYDWDENKPKFGWQDTHPIVNVTWFDATAYAKWAGVNLPTEAQWEKAARGNDGRIYPWGNIWVANNTQCSKDDWKDVELTVHIGSFSTDASPYGVLDMAGNVKEWCDDWYDYNYHRNSSLRNPLGSAKTEYRVVRGGSWKESEIGTRSSCRDFYFPGNFKNDTGFRCALPDK